MSALVPDDFAGKVKDLTGNTPKETPSPGSPAPVGIAPYYKGKLFSALGDDALVKELKKAEKVKAEEYLQHEQMVQAQKHKVQAMLAELEKVHGPGAVVALDLKLLAKMLEIKNATQLGEFLANYKIDPQQLTLYFDIWKMIVDGGSPVAQFAITKSSFWSNLGAGLIGGLAGGGKTTMAEAAALQAAQHTQQLYTQKQFKALLDAKWKEQEAYINEKLKEELIKGPMAPLLQSAATGGKDNWGTPPELVEWVAKTLEVTFDLDPFAEQGNAKAPLFFDLGIDGYSVDWFGHVFLNPPYSQVAKALVKAAYEFKAGHCETIVALVAARPDTQWWWDAVQTCNQILFLKGRVKFLDPDGKVQNPAPFPSAFLIWDISFPKDQPTQVAWVDWKADTVFFCYNPPIDAIVTAANGANGAPEASDTLPTPAPHTGDSPGGDPQ